MYCVNVNSFAVNVASCGWLQASQQFCVFVNDKLMKSADVQLDSSYQPTILVGGKTVRMPR